MVMAGVGLAVTRPAMAFKMPADGSDSPIELGCRDGCGPEAAHEDLLALLADQLKGDPTRNSLSAVCPTCRRQVTVRR